MASNSRCRFRQLRSLNAMFWLEGHVILMWDSPGSYADDEQPDL